MKTRREPLRPGTREGRAADGGPPLSLPRRLPLFWKIVLANATVAVLAVAVGGLLARGAGGEGASSLHGMAVVLGLAVLLGGFLVSAALVRLALTPVEELKRAAEQVRTGRLQARSMVSPWADPELRTLMASFNDMLDTLSLQRHRQQELARRVLEAEERERGRIAHELYSGTAQTLAGVLVRLRVAERQIGDGAAGMGEIREAVVDALEEVRAVARRLRPPELDELGVGVALEAHARSMTEGTGVEATFEGQVPPLSREASLALFRIVQEAINNAVIHGRPDRVTIRFESRDDRLVAEVVDDGIGFDLEDSLLHTSESLGLFGMHERAGYVQGELSVESGPGRGTRVMVSLPFHPEADRPGSSLDGAVGRLMEGLVDVPRHAESTVGSGTEPVTV